MCSQNMSLSLPYYTRELTSVGSIALQFLLEGGDRRLYCGVPRKVAACSTGKACGLDAGSIPLAAPLLSLLPVKGLDKAVRDSQVSGSLPPS